ncbi:MAG: aspartate carbamoyltransferase catalytic subunit, partial [Pseudobdellovibrionaceae bacterium]
MPSRLSSLLDLQSIPRTQIESLFSFAESLKKNPRPVRNRGESVILAFFEASTRTRLSFETACVRSGVGPVLFDGGLKTSLEKGETVEDSLLNMAAMRPSALIVRCSDSLDLPQLALQLKVPVINAGWGVRAHPTQALLDVFTLKSKWSSLEGKKLLILGDVKHSRVAHSHVELASHFGIKLGQCGPEGFISENPIFQTFQKLEDGLQWADAVVALRFQFERHDSTLRFSKEDFRNLYGLSVKSLRALKSESWVMHPGPINHGIEMETEVLQDPRCC